MVEKRRKKWWKKVKKKEKKNVVNGNVYVNATFNNTIVTITDEPEDTVLIKELLDVMEKNKLDYTNTFRELMNENITNENLKVFV